MNTLGVILARAAGQPLAGVHLRPVLGRPVIDHTFGHARAASWLTRVVVSTDCPEIRHIARQAMFETIELPPELAAGGAADGGVLLHAIDAVEGRGSFRAGAVVLLGGNVAARPAGAVDACVARLAEGAADSVRTFCPAGEAPLAATHTLGGAGGDEVLPARPGDSSALVAHDGACAAVTRQSLEAARGRRGDDDAFLGKQRRGVRTAAGATIVVNEERDLAAAEAALRAAGVGPRIRRAA